MDCTFVFNTIGQCLFQCIAVAPPLPVALVLWGVVLHLSHKFDCWKHVSFPPAEAPFLFSVRGARWSVGLLVITVIIISVDWLAERGWDGIVRVRLSTKLACVLSTCALLVFHLADFATLE